jgi:hypothetical protein
MSQISFNSRRNSGTLSPFIEFRRPAEFPKRASAGRGAFFFLSIAKTSPPGSLEINSTHSEILTPLAGRFNLEEPSTIY